MDQTNNDLPSARRLYPDRILLGPSILTADFGGLADQIGLAERAGVDFIHLDIMDGHFVPNITFGPLVVSAVRTMTHLPLDVHLMIERPERYLEAFANAGATSISIHVETTRHLHAALMSIRDLGVEAGVTLNPLTPVDTVLGAIPIIDQLLVMSVNPGFGGQSFLPMALDRIRFLRATIDSLQADCRLEVDGGIKPTNVGEIVAAGADMLVAGSAIFSSDFSVNEGVQSLRQGIRSN